MSSLRLSIAFRSAAHLYALTLALIHLYMLIMLTITTVSTRFDTVAGLVPRMARPPGAVRDREVSCIGDEEHIDHHNGVLSLPATPRLATPMTLRLGNCQLYMPHRRAAELKMKEMYANMLQASKIKDISKVIVVSRKPRVGTECNSQIGSFSVCLVCVIVCKFHWIALYVCNHKRMKNDPIINNNKPMHQACIMATPCWAVTGQRIHCWRTRRTMTSCWCLIKATS